jgi:hypothetical protein
MFFVKTRYRSFLDLHIRVIIVNAINAFNSISGIHMRKCNAYVMCF